MESREINIAKGTLKITRNAKLLTSIAFGGQILCNLSGNIVETIINNIFYILGICVFLKHAMKTHNVYKDFEIECAVGLKKAIEIQKDHFEEKGALSFVAFLNMLTNLYCYFQDENMARALPMALWCLCGLGYGTAHGQYKRLQKELDEQDKVKILK